MSDSGERKAAASIEHPMMDRRALLMSAGALAAAGAATGALAQPKLPESRMPEGNRPPAPSVVGFDEAKGQYVLPPLPYKPEALEPHIDAKTMELHHTKHHQAYVDGANKALQELKAIREGKGNLDHVKFWSIQLSFNGCGHVNHTLFWNMMAPAGKGGGGQPKGALAEAINRDFGSFDAFVTHFKAAAQQVEGGGWAWLVWEPIAKRLLVIQEEKQQDMMLTGSVPLLGVDVWEHAYYLKYQNRRQEYIAAWMNVVNWGFVQDLFDMAERRSSGGRQ